MLSVALLLLARFGLWLLSLLMWPICRLFSLTRKELPPIHNPLLMHSAKELAYMIRNKQLTSSEVMRAFVERAQEVNPMINAIVEAHFELALSESEKVDKLIASDTVSKEQLEREKPLLGVPITVKESISVKGMSNQAGRCHEQKVQATEDADVVRLVKAAGAIPLLVSNTPELCMFWETYNHVTGKTSNPYDTRRTSGGSSGGEAALLGSGASVIGLGSDIGGSLRLPAMYNGVFGHKPTPWSVSTKGHVPGCISPNWPDFFTLGPMSRYAEDLPLLMSIIAEDDKKMALELHEVIPIKRIKIFYMEKDDNSYISQKVDNSIIQAMRNYILHLEKTHGIVAEKVSMNQMKHSFEVAVSLLLNIDGVESLFYNKEKPLELSNVWSELFKYLTFRSRSTLPVILYGIMKKSFKFFEKRVAEYTERNVAIREEFAKLLGNDGVFLYPTFTGTAHFHYQMYYKILNIAYMAIFNTVGLPVTNCPAGFNSEGLPLGFQVVANPFNDRLCFTVAADVEKFFGGWKPPKCQYSKRIDL